MLGGDDLLLVCGAAHALPFLVAYARALQQPSHVLADGAPLTVGAGVVVAPHTVPFHHLHGVAERLAASAKALHRSAADRPSAVDWSVLTQAWSDDPIATRRRDARVRRGGEALALTARPYRILGRDGRCLDGVDQLHAAAEALHARVQGGAARSQLRAFVHELPRGRRWAELCFDELPKATRGALAELAGHHGPWEEADGRLLTRVGDLVEVFELRRLQRHLPIAARVAS